MYNRKHLILLLCILCVSAAAYILTGYIFTGRKAESRLTAEEAGKTGEAAEADAADAALLDIAPEDVVSISLIGADSETGFSYADGSWSCADIPEMSVAGGRIEELLGELSRLKPQRQLDMAESTEKFGLDKSAAGIEITDADGKVYTLTIGSRTSDGSGYYCMVNADADRIYTISAEAAQLIARDAMYYAQADTMEYMSDPKELNIYLNGTNTLHIFKPEEPERYTYTDYYSWFADIDGETKALDSTAVNRLISALLSVQWEDTAAFSASEEELESFGLKEPELKISLSDGQKENTLLVGAVNAEGGYYAMKEGSHNVYTISAEIRDKYAAADLESLIPNDICHIPWDTVTGMSIRRGTDSLDIAVTGNANGSGYTYTADGSDIDANTVSNFKNIIDLMIPVGTAEAGRSGDELMQVTFYRDTESFSELKLSIMSYDDRNVAVDFENNTGKLVSIEAYKTLSALLDKMLQ